MGIVKEANEKSKPKPIPVASCALLLPTIPADANPVSIEGTLDGPGKVTVATPVLTAGWTVVITPVGKARAKPEVKPASKEGTEIPTNPAEANPSVKPANNKGGGMTQGNAPTPAPSVPVSTVATSKVPDVQRHSPLATPKANCGTETPMFPVTTSCWVRIPATLNGVRGI